VIRDDNIDAYRLVLAAWGVQDEEVSERGNTAFVQVSAAQGELSNILRCVAWQGWAIQEFQDLQPVSLTGDGPFLSVNYAFWEAISTLRESVLSGLNGQAHASLAVLRSALELFTFHYWIQRRLDQENSAQPFYDWLLGTCAAPPFKNIAEDVFKRLDLPDGSTELDEFYDIYRELCSYVHKPLLRESLSTIRGTAVPLMNDQVLSFWLGLLFRTQRVMLDLAIAAAPQALFPVDLWRKFGFGDLPMGHFLDKTSYEILERALGKGVAEDYRRYYKERDPPAGLLQWFESRPDLTDEQILASYNEDVCFDDAQSPFEERVARRWAVVKAKMRAMAQLFAYGPDLQEGFGGRIQ